ncbi:CoA ester lyase [Oxalobacteraceae bacterium R-40]|uniref:CoA ester lyase n=1 Tax=Keguizhuia sedimenti TaxID=3064264 RepID=A0ABU1BQ81_9BURK|nr:CoA ester lyase [Oxalobacteraceae bacterium R-40]
MQPSEILFQDECKPVTIPVCDHYAGSERLMRKSMTLQHELGPVFDITFDCEDGAAAGNEEAHAHLIAALVNSPGNRFNRIGARVHDVTSAHFQNDLKIICGSSAARLAYVVMPKVRNVQDVEDAIELANLHARQAGRNNLPVHVLIETHGALADAHKIAAIPQVECLSFGIMDFVSSHYGAIPAAAMRSPGQFSHPLVMRAKLEIAAACHAYGKVPSHNVTTEIRDIAVAANDAQRAKMEFGYTRMWSIHPEQIKPIVSAFAPTNTEIDKASRILAAAEAAGWGPIQMDGELHDRASYRYYWTVLERTKSGNQSLTDTSAEVQ